jgi:hypothetical protein
MEHRVIIFTDSDAHEIGRRETDSSIINSLPRVGDDILDIAKLNFQENEHLLHAKVRVVEFDYDKGIVNVYAEVLRTA